MAFTIVGICLLKGLEACEYSMHIKTPLLTRDVEDLMVVEAMSARKTAAKFRIKIVDALLSSGFAVDRKDSLFGNRAFPIRLDGVKPQTTIEYPSGLVRR